MKNITIIIAMISILSFSSCQKDRDFNGGREDMEKFLGEELVKSLDEIGFEMNYGEKPPKIVGSYLVSPAKLKSSTVPGDPTNKTFYDIELTFKNQNNRQLTIDYEGTQLHENSIGKGTFIAGNGKFFTVAMKAETAKDAGGIAQTAFIIKGKISNAGIVDIEIAAFNIKVIQEDDIKPFIPENTGRVIIDGNGLAKRL